MYKVYKDAFGDETHLFTESAEFEEGKAELPDDANPDYRGKFFFENGSLRTLKVIY
ncbi:hypothetical protein [Mucilaginibacter conchicola]|uniref:hypothetical protein n=1 Tax=Mucilaginibacter conchicola TaxID=2303333 RepID=UPI00131416FE|nr:hypothetical protein [Mucilaginibacter conchicola]